jgi:hypothetical protein
MENILVNCSKAEAELLLKLTQKMGIKARLLKKDQVEDAALASLIAEGMKSGKASRKSVMDKLPK